MQPSIEAAAQHIIEKATLKDLLEVQVFGQRVQLQRQENGDTPFTDQQLAFNMRKYLEVKLEGK